jgi:hypothetical protein
MLRQKEWKQTLIRYFSTGQGYNVSHSSQLRVVNTNQWPIPYYKRDYSFPRSFFPEIDYNISLDGGESTEPDSANVYYTQLELNKSMWGREILNTMQSINTPGTLNTRIDSPSLSSNIYTEDLLRHIDYSIKENARILKKFNLSEIFD